MRKLYPFDWLGHQRNTPQSFTFIGTDFPDPALFPQEKLARYCHKHRQSVAQLSQAKLLKGYGGFYLKQATMNDLNQHRGFDLLPETLQIIYNRADSLKRVFKMLLGRPGELVINTAVHDPTLEQILKDRQAEIVHVRTSDKHFLESIESSFKQLKVRAIYVRSQCSFPEGHTLNPDDCAKLAELAKKHKVYIIEEEDDHEFWLDGIPHKPLSSYNHDGFVIHLSVLSKATPYMRSLRILIASARLIKMLDASSLPSFENRDVIEEKGIADLMINGDLEEYRRNVRYSAQKNRKTLHLMLQNYLGKHVTYQLPGHGLTFWVHLDDRFDLNPMLKKLEKLGIQVPYHPSNPGTNNKLNNIVLGFGTLDTGETEVVAKLLGEALEDRLYDH